MFIYFRNYLISRLVYIFVQPTLIKMPSEGLIVETGSDSFIGGLEPQQWMQHWGWFVAFIVVAVILLIVSISYGVEVSGLKDKLMSKLGVEKPAGFGNRTRATTMPSGANPNTGLQEGSQPGAGGYGRQWNPTTGQYVYIRPEFDVLDKNLASSLQGGNIIAEEPKSSFAGGPDFHSNTYNRWAKDDREKKGMRMYSDLRQKAIAQGNEWTQTFGEWYKGWKSLPANRLASDAFNKEGMTLSPLQDSELMIRARNGY
jgi:hypothetical protein